MRDGVLILIHELAPRSGVALDMKRGPVRGVHGGLECGVHKRFELDDRGMRRNISQSTLAP